MPLRGFRYRIYPDREQEDLIVRTFGCVRFLYNHCLSEQEDAYRAGIGYLSRTDLNNYCNRKLKPIFLFLREVDKFALTNAICHLDDAYQRMFQKKGGHPKYKSKHRGKQSYTTNFTNRNIEVEGGKIKLPKLGWVKAKVHRQAPGDAVIRSATVTKEADGTYYCSVLYAYERTVTQVPHPEWNPSGMDYKSDGLYVDSQGNTGGSPKYYRRAEKRLKRLHKELSRKQKGSRNREKAYRHEADQRKDHLHKESAAKARQYDLIGVEGLDMRAMSNKGFRNGKATMDNGYGMFLTFLKYKLEDAGKVFIKVDRWFPSSQLCNACGALHPEVKDLSVRTWTCPDCGTKHDRDRNAAVNIETEAVRLFLKG